MKISLDTNVLIFGLRRIDPYAVTVLNNLFRFEVEISAQVEKELRKNLSESELRQFYETISVLSNFRFVYSPADIKVLNFFRQSGLKPGDAGIASFCEQEAVDIFVSENRHFLSELSECSFQIVDSRTFCRMFSLRE